MKKIFGCKCHLQCLANSQYSANEGYMLNGHFYYKRHYLWKNSTSTLGARGVVCDKMGNEREDGGRYDNFFWKENYF